MVYNERLNMGLSDKNAQLEELSEKLSAS